MTKELRVLGYVLARNEWPLLGLSITHALLSGISHVVVLDHGSTDETSKGLSTLENAWPNQITVIRLSEEQLYLQEAITSMAMGVADAQSYDWVYVFDADEFAICPHGKNLIDVFQTIESDFDIVRYELDQWVAPFDFDDLDISSYKRINHRAVAPTFLELPLDVVVDEIVRGNMNFFDVPFPSKVIVRGCLASDISAGAHSLNRSELPNEVRLNSSLMHVAHLPFLSKRRLDMKFSQGLALKQAGFSKFHGWQSQMLDDVNKTIGPQIFWTNHSISENKDPEFIQSGQPSTEVDHDLSEALEAAIEKLKACMVNAKESHRSKTDVSLGSDKLWQVSTSIIHKLIMRSLELSSKRDAVVADRDAVVADRDAVVADRDAVVADRDAVVANRDAVSFKYLSEFQLLQEKEKLLLAELAHVNNAKALKLARLLSKPIAILRKLLHL
jgi:hypothetical protein